MRFKAAILCVGLALVGCKKAGGGGGGPGGGGGGWLVGSSALMTNITPAGEIGSGYNLGATETLYGIACRYLGEAWVVGAAGTLLYTNDAGRSWTAQTIPTGADLRAIATQDAGPVFVAGDGVFMTSSDTGAHWASLGDGVTKFRSVAAAQQGTTVLAVSDDGHLFSYENGALVPRGTIAGARAIAISPDGETALLVGNGIQRSLDGGKTWTPLAVDTSIGFEDVRVNEDGDGVAVGTGGAIAVIDGDGVVIQHVGTADLHTLHIAEVGYSSTGYTAGEGGQVFLTHDGGWSWEPGPNVGKTVFGVDEIGDTHR
jgi:photosystem II stability/assembly factor-like uncharacterized protein